jgi:beta-aspartyl-peptidase (threonine type)
MQPMAILVHGGAGRDDPETLGERRSGCEAATESAWRVLCAGGSALDAVEAAVVGLEEHPLFNAGVGSCLTRAGTVEMDASIMDGRRLAGAGVAVVRTVLHPVRLARAVLDDGRHVLMAGAGAEALAHEHALPTAAPTRLVTARQLERWRARRAVGGGTVGAVALDRRGDLAAATSTGGLWDKLPGRIGDSAILGAGTYADNRAGAASATGDGERILTLALTRRAVELLREGRAPDGVVREAIAALGEHGGKGGMILVDRFGRAAWSCNTEEMVVALRPAPD